jgi:hypothetical protein
MLNAYCFLMKKMLLCLLFSYAYMLMLMVAYVE